MIQRKRIQISYIRRAKSLLIVLVLFLNVLCLLCCTKAKTKDVPFKTSSSQSVTKSNGRFVDPYELYDEEELRFALEDAYDKIGELEGKIEEAQMFIGEAKNEIETAKSNIDDVRYYNDNRILDEVESNLDDAESELDNAEDVLQ